LHLAHCATFQQALKVKKEKEKEKNVVSPTPKKQSVGQSCNTFDLNTIN